MCKSVEYHCATCGKSSDPKFYQCKECFENSDHPVGCFCSECNPVEDYQHN